MQRELAVTFADRDNIMLFMHRSPFLKLTPPIGVLLFDYQKRFVLKLDMLPRYEQFHFIHVTDLTTCFPYIVWSYCN